MRSVDQVSRGLAGFFDAEIRPSLSGWKAIAYGIAVGRIASNLPVLLGQYSGVLSAMGLIHGDQIDVEGLAAEIKEQMRKNGGELVVPVMGDEFRFSAADIDSVLRHIERA